MTVMAGSHLFKMCCSLQVLLVSSRKHRKLTLYKLSSFSLPFEQKLRGEGMPRAHTAVSSPASMPVSHSTPPDTQSVAEWTRACRRPHSTSLHFPFCLSPNFTVAASSVIPQTIHLRPCASLWEMQIVCHSSFEWRVTIEITIQHRYLRSTYFYERIILVGQSFFVKPFS